MAARTSVVVPTWDEAKYLPTLLASMRAQTVPPLEVIVADSGSTDGTPDLARAAGSLVLEGGRKGPGEGRNRGARAAHGDILLFVDADCIFFRKDSFERLGGLREDMLLNETHDLAMRSRPLGVFRILPVTVRTSMRRVRAHGYARTLLTEYVASTLLYYATGRTPAKWF